MMESLQQRVETWIRDQRAKILKVQWPTQWRMAVRWPWNTARGQRKRFQEEYERKKKLLHDLSHALQAESVSDLQDILCCMVLSECVYKRPAAEMVRVVNKFKADFGGEVVSLERVQPSSDHVPHRYLLAEAGDTLFASFIGTKQYKDVMADANIFQGAIFHEDAAEDVHETETSGCKQVDCQKVDQHNFSSTPKAIPKEAPLPKPAAHRGFMSRAKGIPALELYRLAQKKKRKLVLCGHSLGGAVATLATLAILRVIAPASSSKENEKVQIKCITFSQPPVGNAALKDYVHRKGWQHYFKSYCIPEDLVPRILSPAYFHHYSAQPWQTRIDTGSLSTSKHEELVEKQKTEKVKENEGDPLVLGLGPVQRSFWRLSRLVPLIAVKRQFSRFGGKQINPLEMPSATNSMTTSAIDNVADAPQSLEIQEGSDGVSLQPYPELAEGPTGEAGIGKPLGKSDVNNGNKSAWHRMPYLPSYVPFGQLYLLGNSSVELLSGAEYSKLTSVSSVISELRERFQSHSMKSYRSRFQRIYDLCMKENVSSLLGGEQVPQFPHLQKMLGISVAGSVELGHIVESPVIQAATSIVPLEWSGIPVEKNGGERLKVDISGFGLHLCTLIQARVNGNWCSTTVEAFPSQPSYSSDHGLQPEIQKMRILVGAPLKRPRHKISADSIFPVFPSLDSDPVDVSKEQNIPIVSEGSFIRPDGLSDFVVYCTTDFSTVSKEVYIRTRRVRLIGLEGAGKTSLFKAVMCQGRPSTNDIENLCNDADVQEGIAGGLCFSDSTGVNLQDLTAEASRFRDELWKGIRDLSKKTDLIVLVHNLSHKVPLYGNSNASQKEPALSLLLDEVKSLGIPWILAITNKFSVSAHQQKAAIRAVLQAYQASPNTTEIVNSCKYVMPSIGVASLSWGSGDTDSDVKMGSQKPAFAPLKFVRRSFQRKASIFPVEGVNSLCQLIHRLLQNHEEAALQELARDRLLLELVRGHAAAIEQSAQAATNSISAAAVGASLGAGLGVVLAIVMGAASALRKP